MTQKEFAERLHIPLRTLQGWEAGRPIPEHIMQMINKTIWLEEIAKEQSTRGGYENMINTIEKTEYTKENYNNLMERLFPGAKAAYDALSEEEKELRQAEAECSILNEDLADELGDTYEYRPVFVEGLGWVNKRLPKKA